MRLDTSYDRALNASDSSQRPSPFRLSEPFVPESHGKGMVTSLTHLKTTASPFHGLLVAAQKHLCACKITIDLPQCNWPAERLREFPRALEPLDGLRMPSSVVVIPANIRGRQRQFMGLCLFIQLIGSGHQNR